MPARKGLLAPQNNFLETIATRFDGTHSNFVLGNAKITRIYPIVYCSDGFCELTGYSRAQIMQKSCACNFLYGSKTDAQHRSAITAALEAKQELKLEVILYRRSGTPFWCLLDIVPIHDDKHEVVLFLCSHKDITKQKLHEQQQKVAAAQALHQQQLAHFNDQHPQQQQQQHQSDQHHNQLQANHSEQALVQLNSAGNESKQPADSQHHGQSVDASGKELAVEQYCDPSGEQASQLQRLQALKQQEQDDQQALIGMEEFGIDELASSDEQADEQDENEHGDKNTTSQYSRRRSRAVLYQLSGHYTRRSVNMKSKLKLNNRMTIPEYKTTTIEKQRFILSHYGLGKSCWDWLILIVSFYVAIVVPYNATFKEKSRPFGELMYTSESNEQQAADRDQFWPPSNNRQSSSESAATSGSGNQSHASAGSDPYEFGHDHECEIDSIDIFVEVVFIIDVILNFRTTFVNRKGEVVTRPKIICRHYVRGWFIVDACAALPFDLLCGLNLYSRSRLKIDLNLLKLIRLLRLARLLQKMDRYSQYSYIILTLLMLIFSLLAHWCACIWYVIAMTEIERHPPEWKLGWIHQLSDKLGYNVVNATDMASSYVTALYFTTSSLTSVGFGNVSANTNAEKIFSIVIMLIGALMHAVVFGNVTALIRVMYARRSNYQTRLRDLKDFFRLHQLPKDLQQRMSDYFQTTWSLNNGIDTYEILRDFPEELRGDVSLHLHREVLSLPIFASAPHGFLKSLARHIETKFCCPTEHLIHRGDALNYLYLVCNGSMEVLHNNMVVAILGKGDLIGYDVNALAQSNQPASASAALVKSSSDLKALTYCDLKCIHIGGLLEVLKLYPEFSDTFHEEIVHDLTFNLREELEGEQELDMDADENDEDEPEDDDDDDEPEDDDEPSDTHPGPPSSRATGRRQSGPPLSATSGKTCDQSSAASDGAPSNANANNMGKLVRSIASSQQDATQESTHQIGRYDFEEDDEATLAGSDEEQEDEDEEETEAEAEAEEAGDRSGPDEETSETGDDDDNRPGGATALRDSTHQVGGEQNEWRSAGPNASQRQQSGPPKDGSERAKEQERLLASSEHLDAKRGQMTLSPTSGSLSTSATGPNTYQADSFDAPKYAAEVSPGARVFANRAINGTPDLREHLSHSYDGLLDSRRARAGEHKPPESASGKLSSSSLTQVLDSTPDELEVLGAPSQSGDFERERQHPPVPLARLKPAIGQQQSAARGTKPPISFDLSRNTTAIVDRRRRSAGCIQRLTLISGTGHPNESVLVGRQRGQQEAQTATSGKRCHSSLIHINENEPMASTRIQMPVRATSSNQQFSSAQSRRRRKSIERLGSSQSQPAAGQHELQIHTISAGQRVKLERVQSSYSSQDLKQIDAHITASVRKLRQEFKLELNNAIETLARLMLERQQADLNGNAIQLVGSNHSSLSASNANAAIGPSPRSLRPQDSLAHYARLRRRKQVVENTSSDPVPIPVGELAKSPLARSISSSSLPACQATVGIADSNQAADHQTTVSPGGEHLKPINQFKSTNLEGRSARIVIADASSRPTSQCSNAASLLSGGPNDKQQGGNALLFVNSDNDSGRSTSSVNSSGAANRLLQHQQHNQQLDAAPGGRPVKLFIATSNQSTGASYTLDIQEASIASERI